MSPTVTIPMHPLPTTAPTEEAVRIEDIRASNAHRRRAQSLPGREPSGSGARAMSLETLQDAIELGRGASHCGSATVSEDLANAFLRRAGLDVALKGTRLVVTRHSDPEAAEAQRAPSAPQLAQICRTLMLAEETPAKLDVAKILLPAINAQLLDAAEAEQPDENFSDRAKGAVKAYFKTLGGRDLGLDDAISACNTYLFDKIGDETALNSGNIAAAVLTASLMLLPTIGKNLPIIADAIREGRHQDAIMPALSILAISAMTTNPILAACGKDQASAVAAAAGNVLMMTNLPAMVRDGLDWSRLLKTDVDPQTQPFTQLARKHGLVDKGLHTAIDFLHEFAAQAGFLVLNVINAAKDGEAAGNPVSFGLLGTLLGSFLVNVAQGEQPFTEFAPDRSALADVLTEPGGGASRQAAQLFLQQKTAQTYDPAGYASLTAPFLEQPVSDHAARQVRPHMISDSGEMAFLKGLMARFCVREETKDAVHDAIDRIYRFERFDPAEATGDDRMLGEILRFIQTERNNDKGYGRAARGVVSANHVYRNIIAHAIKCAAFEELGHRA